MTARHLAAAATAVAFTINPTSALANTATAVQDIQTALRQQGESPAVQRNRDVTVFNQGENGVAISTSAGKELQLGLPATGVPDLHNGLAVYQGARKDNQIAVQTTPGGVRALIHIDSPTAPERYEFPLTGDVANLAKLGDDSVLVFNTAGEIVGLVAAPWAQDQAGTPVPTHYEINGTTLVQIVEHRGGSYMYGVTADPFWDSWGKAIDCTAWFATNIGFFGGLKKILNIRKAAKAGSKAAKAAIQESRARKAQGLPRLSKSEKMERVAIAIGAAGSAWFDWKKFKENCVS